MSLSHSEKLPAVMKALQKITNYETAGGTTEADLKVVAEYLIEIDQYPALTAKARTWLSHLEKNSTPTENESESDKPTEPSEPELQVTGDESGKHLMEYFSFALFRNLTILKDLLEFVRSQDATKQLPTIKESTFNIDALAKAKGDDTYVGSSPAGV
jgi:hypothetical protein